MRTDSFDYPVDENLISQHPRERGESRLMILDRRDGSVVTDIFLNIGRYLPDNAVLVLNDTKVFKARLYAEDQEKRVIEVFVTERLNENHIKVLLRPRKKLSSASVLTFKDGTTAVFSDYDNNYLKLSKPMNFDDFDRIGEVPLPVYIKRKADHDDEQDYQTVYAQNQGSIAAPTAGFHFTEQILNDLKENKSIETVKITHHIGYATFRPIKTENVEEHEMLEEFYTITPAAAELINNAKIQGRRIIAVGTSSVRATESSSDEKGIVMPQMSGTNLFIYPGYKFKCLDHMITNFHLPSSAPLMMVCALAGKENIHNAYREAVKENFKFYSYGDAMLII